MLHAAALMQILDLERARLLAAQGVVERMARSRLAFSSLPLGVVSGVLTMVAIGVVRWNVLAVVRDLFSGWRSACERLARVGPHRGRVK